MTGDELDDCLTRIGWSQMRLADRLGIRHTTVVRWRHDRQPIPEPIAHWLDKVARFHDRTPPPPRDWQRSYPRNPS